MKTYNVTRLENDQRVVLQINANVAIATFRQNGMPKLADLYTSTNECDILVGHRSCPPVDGTFVETVLLVF